MPRRAIVPYAFLLRAPTNSIASLRGLRGETAEMRLRLSKNALAIAL